MNETLPIYIFKKSVYKYAFLEFIFRSYEKNWKLRETWNLLVENLR